MTRGYIATTPSPDPTHLTVTTQPSSAVSTGVAFPQQPAIQLRDVSNNAVSQSGVVVTVAIGTGSNTLGGTLTATTNGSGVATFTNLSLTGSADDTDTLSFTSPGLTGVSSNVVTIDPSGPGPGSNEPVGMTMLLTHDGTAVQPNAAWDYAYADPARGSLTVVTDTEKGSVVQLAMTPVTWPGEGSGSLSAGNGSSDSWATAFAPTKFYICWWEKLSPSYVGNNGSMGQKNVWVVMQSQYGTDAWLMGIDNNNLDPDVAPSSNLKPEIDLYSIVAAEGNSFSVTNGQMMLPAQGDVGDVGNIWPRGTWSFFEAVFVLNARGVANGSVQMWVDGIAYPNTGSLHPNQVFGLIMTGVQLATDVGPRLTAITIGNTWGGGGTVLPCDNYYRFKDLYVSGGYARSGDAPSNWVITLAAGADSTPAAGTSVELVAQLVDGNAASVDVFGQLLQPTLHVTGPATVTRHADPGGAPYALEYHGTVLLRVDVSGGATSGADIAVTLDDFARVNNNTTNGTQRLSNTLHLTVA